MTEVLKPDICVIGAGSAGLVVAAGGSQMGAEVVLIEKGKTQLGAHFVTADGTKYGAYYAYVEILD